MLNAIHEHISTLDTTSLSSDRKAQLQILVDYITESKKKGEKVKLNFICTHNSRRSQLCHVWAKTIAEYYAIKDIKSYSGGTEATRVYKTVIDVLINTGFEITTIANYKNPTFKVNFTEEHCPMTLFSKRHNDRYNPREDFAAVMTCTDADQNCPVIPNAIRISLPYADPKVSDGTKEESSVYADRSIQIATEMKYVFSQIK